MSREIKFKAWDNVGKVMYQWGYLADIAYTTDFGQNYGNNLLRYDIMQFTGLQDKNGRDIYESDVTVDKDGRPGCVLWMTDGFWVRNRNGTYGLSSAIQFFHIEIVGNICENPELIE